MQTAQQHLPFWLNRSCATSGTGHGSGVVALPQELPARIEAAFEVGLTRWGSRPALEIGDTSVSYLELDARATSLAHQLRSMGVKAGEVVAVATGDIVEWASGMLAAWRLGAAALPLDARYPVLRVTDILLDSAAKVLVADYDFPASVVPADVPVLRVPAPALSTPGAPLLPKGASWSANDIAYLCYTSGSTGKPKGIRVPHRGVPYLAGDRALLSIDPTDRMAQCCNFAFDVSQYELWVTLLNGACLVAVPRRVLTSPRDLGQFIAEQGITMLCPTTALFNAISRQHPQAFAGVKSVLIAGEAADAHALGRVLRSSSPPQRIVNAYGPTEATIYASWHQVTVADVDAGLIPIGRATRGTTLHVRDAQLQDVPPGEVGELFISGTGVTSGYLNLPDLTAQRFIDLPVSGQAAGATVRAYRSGDLCRRRSDGALEYLGRVDDQLKINGHRVEPAEVASAICKIPGVSDAVVLGRPTSFGSKELVAAVIGGQPLSPADIKNQVSLLLPRYLVPAAIEQVESFPLTAAGKIDRQALLALFATSTQPSRSAHADASIERTIAALWTSFAQRPDVGLDDTQVLTDIDSMSLLHLAIEIEFRYGVQLGVADVAPGTSLRQLAATVRDRIDTGKLAPASPPTRSAASAEEAAPAAHPTVLAIAYPWRLWTWPEEIPLALSQGQPWHQLDVPVSLLARPGKLSVEDIARSLLVQIDARALPGPYVICGHSFCGLLAYELAQRLREQGRNVACVVMLDAKFRIRRTGLNRILFAIRRALVLISRDSAAVKRTVWWYTQWFRHRMSVSVGGPTDDVFFRCCEAMRRYVPQPYAGRVLTFTAMLDTDIAHCGRASDRPDLFTGEYLDVPMLCDHLDMIDSAVHRQSIADQVRQLPAFA